MEIEYYTKNVYGRDLKYIKDEKIQQNMERLTGTKALMPYQVECLNILGFTFKEVLPD